MIAKQKARLELGYWPFDIPPGYVNKKVPGHGKLLTPDSNTEKVEAIREALEGFAVGRFVTQMDVVNFLDERRFSHRRPYKKVHPQQVKRLLSRVLYAGYIEFPQWGVTRRKGHHEAIISLETYERIQERLGNKPVIDHLCKRSNDFPLRGFIICAVCQHPMTASWTKGRNGKHPYYRCTGYGCVFEQKSMKRKDVEEGFEEILKLIDPAQEVLDFMQAVLMEQWDTRVADVKAVRKKRDEELKDLEGEIAKLTRRVTKTDSSALITAYETQIEELSTKVDLLKRQGTSNRPLPDFGTAVEQCLEVVRNPYGMWNTKLEENQNLVLKLIFDKPLPYHRETGFGTATFSLPVAISNQKKLDEYAMVEMPGIEPGSNV